MPSDDARDYDRDQERDQFHGRGDYAGPDVAVENVRAAAPVDLFDALTPEDIDLTLEAMGLP